MSEIINLFQQYGTVLHIVKSTESHHNTGITGKKVFQCQGVWEMLDWTKLVSFSTVVVLRAFNKLSCTVPSRGVYVS